MKNKFALLVICLALCLTFTGCLAEPGSLGNGSSSFTSASSSSQDESPNAPANDPDNDELATYRDGVDAFLDQTATQFENSGATDAQKTELLKLVGEYRDLETAGASKEALESKVQSMFDLTEIMEIKIQSGMVRGERLCDVLGYPTLLNEEATGLKEGRAWHIGIQYDQVGVLDGAEIVWYQDDYNPATINSNPKTLSLTNGVTLLLEGHWYNTYIFDGKYSIYDLPHKDMSGWYYTLGSARANEHLNFYGGAQTVEVWDITTKKSEALYDTANGTLTIDGVIFAHKKYGQEHEYFLEGKVTEIVQNIPRGVIIDLDPDEIIEYNGRSYRVIEYLEENKTPYEFLENGGVRVRSGTVAMRTCTLWDENNRPAESN